VLRATIVSWFDERAVGAFMEERLEARVM